MKFPVLSYTLVNCFNACPHQAYHRYIAKTIPFQKTEAMVYGDDVHKAMERRLKEGKVHTGPHERTLDKAYKYCSLLDDIGNKDYPVRVEYFIGIKIDASPCAWDADGVWFRGKADVGVIVPPFDGRSGQGWLIDWKTGNKREDPFELECQSMLLHAHHPNITSWVGEYFWFKEDYPYGLRHTLDPMRTHQKVGGIYGDMVKCWETGNWPKRKNPLCPWCSVSSCENFTGGKGK
jgi:hypothetical protein